MYRNIVLTLMLVVAIIIAIELARSRPAPAPLDDRAEKEFAAARAVLERRIPELKLNGVTVGQALEEIRRKTGIPVAVNWTSLDSLRDRQVDIDLHDIAIGDALQFLFCLDRYNTTGLFGVPQAEFDVVNGTLIVGKAAMLPPGPRTFPSAAMKVRCYDVRDLVDDPYWGYQPASAQATQRESRLAALAVFVQQYAGMNNWEIVGQGSSVGWPSGAGTTKAFAGRLIVVQTTYGHMRTERFLARLRAAGSVFAKE